MKIFKIDLFYLSKHYFLRNDVKFLNYKTSINKNKKYILLKNVFNVINGNSYTEYYTEEKTKIPFIRVGDLSFKDNIEEQDLIYLNEDVKIPNEKILKENDLILATIGTLGKVNLITKKFIGGTFSNNTVLLRLKNKNNNPIFIEKLLQSDYMQSIINKVKSQKAQPNLQTFDLLNIKIPLIPLEIQNQVAQQIIPLENKIKELKSQILDQKLIINDIFAEEFGFDKNLYKELSKGMTAGTQICDSKPFRIFKINFKDFSNSYDLRFSTRFHNKITKKLMNILSNLKTQKLKDIVMEQIHRGSSPVYDSNGEIQVVKIAHLKNSYIENNFNEFVSNDFYKKSPKSQTLKNDILLSSTGKVSLGKVDINEFDNENIVVDSHVSIIRTNKYNPLFLVYFFRSVLGYFQIERDYTGTTNQIELYPKDIQNFLIPNISLHKQQAIVNKIKSKLEEQNKIQKLIDIERQKIENLIESVIND